MSTRSIVGIKTADGFFGRYCNSDGHPSHQLAFLATAIERDGGPKVAETLMSADKGGWSHLDAEISDNHLSSDRGELVEGYGLSYLDLPKEDPTSFLEAVGQLDIEYVYFVDPETGLVYWNPNRTFSDLQVWTPGDALPAS